MCVCVCVGGDHFINCVLSLLYRAWSCITSRERKSRCGFDFQRLVRSRFLPLSPFPIFFSFSFGMQLQATCLGQQPVTRHPQLAIVRYRRRRHRPTSLMPHSLRYTQINLCIYIHTHTHTFVRACACECHCKTSNLLHVLLVCWSYLNPL